MAKQQDPDWGEYFRKKYGQQALSGHWGVVPEEELLASFGEEEELPIEEPDLFPSYPSMLRYSYAMESPCEIEPEVCTPRHIEHVVWDADDTIWELTGSRFLTTKCEEMKQVSPNKFEAKCEYRKKRKKQSAKSMTIAVELKPDLLDTLDKLEEKGIGSSIASLNPPGSVEKIIDAMGIRKRFDVIISSSEQKDAMVNAISEKTGVGTDKMIFVDDTAMEVNAVFRGTKAMPLVMYQDIQTPGEVLKFIKDD